MSDTNGDVQVTVLLKKILGALHDLIFYAFYGI